MLLAASQRSSKAAAQLALGACRISRASNHRFVPRERGSWRCHPHRGQAAGTAGCTPFVRGKAKHRGASAGFPPLGFESRGRLCCRRRVVAAGLALLLSSGCRSAVSKLSPDCLFLLRELGGRGSPFALAGWGSLRSWALKVLQITKAQG